MTEPVDNTGDAGLIVGSSRRSPAPVGVTIKTIIERGNAYELPDIYNLDMTVLEVVRGARVIQRFGEAGLSADSCDPGFECVMARVKAGYFRKRRGPGGEAYRLEEGQFAAVSPDTGTEYEFPALPPGLQQLYGVFSPGESHEGWVFLQVPEDEKAPLLIFKRPNAGGVHEVWGHLWFRLY